MTRLLDNLNRSPYVPKNNSEMQIYSVSNFCQSSALFDAGLMDVTMREIDGLSRPPVKCYTGPETREAHRCAC